MTMSPFQDDLKNTLDRLSDLSQQPWYKDKLVREVLASTEHLDNPDDRLRQIYIALREALSPQRLQRKTPKTHVGLLALMYKHIHETDKVVSHGYMGTLSESITRMFNDHAPPMPSRESPRRYAQDKQEPTIHYEKLPPQLSNEEKSALEKFKKEDTENEGPFRRKKAAQATKRKSQHLEAEETKTAPFRRRKRSKAPDLQTDTSKSNPSDQPEKPVESETPKPKK